MKRLAVLTAIVFVLGCGGSKKTLKDAGDSAAPADVAAEDRAAPDPDISTPEADRTEELAPQDVQAPPDVADVQIPPDIVDLAEEAEILPDLVETAEEIDTVDLVEEIPESCPVESPDWGDPCLGTFSCNYGEECCCNDCYDATICDCMGDKFGCYSAEACLNPWCEMPPCCKVGVNLNCEMLNPGDICAAVPGSDYGRCKESLPYPACWDHDSCEGGELCKDSEICPCDADCDGADEPGLCLPNFLQYGCCLSEDHCLLGEDKEWICAGEADGEPGLCLEKPSVGQCWDNNDCAPGQTCEGATFCPCGTVCGQIQAPGNCTGGGGGPGDLCGPSGGDCAPGLVCCYPCGIPDCDWKCQEPCDPGEVWCSEGCPMVP